MYLVHIYNSFIFNLFLTFSLRLTLIYVFIRLKLVLVWEDQVAVHVRETFDMLKSQMWQNN